MTPTRAKDPNELALTVAQNGIVMSFTAPKALGVPPRKMPIAELVPFLGDHVLRVVFRRPKKKVPNAIAPIAFV